MTFSSQCHQNALEEVWVLTNLIRKQKTDAADLAWSQYSEIKSMGSEGTGRFVPGLFHLLALGQVLKLQNFCFVICKIWITVLLTQASS